MIAVCARVVLACRGLWAGWHPVARSRSRQLCTACSSRRTAKRRVQCMHTSTPQLLAAIWLLPTRLETRTKESNMCASLGVTETQRRNESEGCHATNGCWRTGGLGEISVVVVSAAEAVAHHRPTYSTPRKV